MFSKSIEQIPSPYSTSNIENKIVPFTITSRTCYRYLYSYDNIHNNNPLCKYIIKWWYLHKALFRIVCLFIKIFFFKHPKNIIIMWKRTNLWNFIRFQSTKWNMQCSVLVFRSKFFFLNRWVKHTCSYFSSDNCSVF